MCGHRASRRVFARLARLAAALALGMLLLSLVDPLPCEAQDAQQSFRQFNDVLKEVQRREQLRRLEPEMGRGHIPHILISPATPQTFHQTSYKVGGIELGHQKVRERLAQSFTAQPATPSEGKIIKIPGYTGPAPDVAYLETPEEIQAQMLMAPDLKTAQEILRDWRNRASPQYLKVPNGYLVITPRQGGGGTFKFIQGLSNEHLRR